MRRHLVQFVVAVLSAGLVVIPVAAGTSRTAKGACKYVKVSDVAKILETPAEKLPSATGGKLCAFAPKQHDLPEYVHVVVENGEDAKIVYSVSKQTFKDKLEKAPGLGKKSFYAGGGINTVFVMQGGTVFSVQYVKADGDPDEIKSAAVKLANFVRGRL